MNTIESVIKQIIEAQGYLYFRSININDLNEQVGNIDVSQGIGVYSSLPSIEYSTFASNSNVLMAYDITVYYLKLNPETDDKGDVIDDILNDLYPDASQFFDYMKQSGIIPPGQYIESYSLKATDTLKMTKEVLTGWELTMTIPLYRKDFICPPSINP